jgi:DNA-binding response OmpR family regulator
MILIIDDDPAFLEQAREVLNHERQVFFAGNTQLALRLAGDLGFSVVLVDLELGHENGLELISQMREKFPGLPIIAVDDSSQKTLGMRARQLGAIEVLSKPITPAWKPVVERVRAMADRH